MNQRVAALLPESYRRRNRWMWYLIRAELDYHKYMLLAGYAVLIAVALIFGLEEHRFTSGGYFIGTSLSAKFTLLSWLVIAGHSYFTYRILATQKQEQRLRFCLPLPVTRAEIGRARINLVLILHTVTFIMLVFWVVFILDINTRSFWLIVSGYRHEINTMVAWTSLGILSFSLCVSFAILLLESRRERPLLSTAQWVVLGFIALILIPSLTGLRMYLLPERWSLGINFSRGISRMVNTGQWGIMLIPLLPYFLLVAAALGYWYLVRCKRRTSYLE